MFDRYHGKVLIHVESQIKADCKNLGYSFSVMDKSFPNNIDVNHRRLNVFVDDNFVIKKIWVG